MTQLALLKPQTGVFAAPGRKRLGSKPRERRLASMLTSEKRPLLADARSLPIIAPVHARPLVNSRPPVNSRSPSALTALPALVPRLRLPLSVIGNELPNFSRYCTERAYLLPFQP